MIDYYETKEHPDSYGYRPGRNAHMAIQSAIRRCSKIGWVLDIDISGFFDNIPHDLLLKAVGYYTQEKWKKSCFS